MPPLCSLLPQCPVSPTTCIWAPKGRFQLYAPTREPLWIIGCCISNHLKGTSSLQSQDFWKMESSTFHWPLQFSNFTTEATELDHETATHLTIYPPFKQHHQFQVVWLLRNVLGNSKRCKHFFQSCTLVASPLVRGRMVINPIPWGFLYPIHKDSFIKGGMSLPLDIRSWDPTLAHMDSIMGWWPRVWATKVGSLAATFCQRPVCQGRKAAWFYIIKYYPGGTRWTQSKHARKVSRLFLHIVMIQWK